MDSRERASTTEETIRMAFQSMEAALWTAIPGIIQSFNAEAMTCVVQPAIQAKQRNKLGVISNVTLPQLLDCPVIFPAGGGFALTFPLAKGNECLVIFANRCIDAWWQQGGVQPPMELRMHDLSDGFVLAGVFSQPNKLSGISTTSTQLRTNGGDTFLDLSPTTITLSAQNVIIHSSSKVSMDADGTGFVITPSLITTYEDGVATAHSTPTPPGPL